MPKLTKEDFQKAVQNKRLLGVIPILQHIDPDLLFVLWEENLESLGSIPKEAIFSAGVALALKYLKELEE